MAFMKRKITQQEVKKYDLETLCSKYKSYNEFNLNEYESLYDGATGVWFFPIGSKFMLADKYSKLEVELISNNTFFDPDLQRFTFFYKCKTLSSKEDEKLLEEAMNTWVNAYKDAQHIWYSATITFIDE